MNINKYNDYLSTNLNNLPKSQVNFTSKGSKIPKFLLEELLAKGVSCEKIGKMYNMSTSMVHYFVDLYGLKTNRRKTTDFLDKKMPIYISLQYGLKRILKETELTSDRINRWIEKNIKEKAQIFFERERKKLLLSNLSNTEVAEKLGVDVARVKVLRRAEKHIVGDYAKNERYGRVLNLWKSGMSKEDIAKKFDISIATINRYIREYKRTH